MIRVLRTCAPLAGLALSIGLPAAKTAAAETADLRVYGHVAADIASDRAVFACESVEKADILMDKLQADLFWDKTLRVERSQIRVAAATVDLWSAGRYGAIVIARAGKQVVVLGAPDEKQVAERAAKEPLLRVPGVTSRASKPHPICLDFFDNKAYKVDTSGTADHWRFMESLGASLNIMGPRFEMECPAPGVMNWTSQDVEVREAERRHEMISLGPWAGPVPLWVRNLDPAGMMQPSGTTVLGDWAGAREAGTNVESWATPPEQRMTRGLGYERAAIERYLSSPAVGGWMIFAGAPGWEYTLRHGRAMQAWDASPTGQAGFRRWLREERRLSLADLGTRWYADPRHFSTWDEVQLPDLNEFFGELGPDCLRLTKGWRWRNLKGGAPGPLDREAAGWVPVDMPPSQRVAFTSRNGVNYYDIAFDPRDWLSKQPAGAETWLVFGLIGWGHGGARVWLNGDALKLPDDDASRDCSFAIPVMGLLKHGANDLQVALNCAPGWMNCRGEPAGPVFLTSHEPKRFPFLGPQANARFVDLADWRAWAITDYHRRAVELARKLDPDRPFLLSGGSDALFDYGTQLCADFGMGREDTGREAGYRPWFPGGGLAAGYYGAAEFSNTALGPALDRAFAWTMFDADSSHNLYGDIDAYEKEERENGWFSRHRRQIELFGKYLREQPQVALLFSGQSRRYFSVGWSDVGLDALPATHYDNVYLSEIGLKAGLADAYPVLFDVGNPFMDAATVDAIRKYASQGGSFIALDDTGLHTEIDPNCCPLAEVSGFRPAGTRSGKIRFESDLPIFKGWENREFEGRGAALDAVPSVDDVVPLARWSDGSVAIGCRKVGTGRVVTLGCKLWKDGRDPSGTWKTREELQRGFLSQLLADCGVARNADASTPEVWARKMVTKNGLQNWLLAFNTKAEARKADVWMAVANAPDQVVDLDTGESVPFVFENHGVTIRGVQFAPYAVRIFAVRRGTLAGGLPVWWHEKTKYWRRTPAEIEAATRTLPAPSLAQDDSVIPISRWRFQTDPDQALVRQGRWATTQFDDADWKVRENGPWNLLDPTLRDYHGTGLYRFKFAAPPAWAGRRILLNLYSYDDPIAYDAGQFFVNGVAVASYKAHRWSQTYNYDLTDLVHPGENVLALKVDGGAENSGLAGSVWIEARPTLSETQDLRGTWHAVQGDWLTRTDAAIPTAGVRAKYLTREVRIPAEWKGKDVFIEWSSKNQWVGCVVVDGRPINYNSVAHPYGTISRVNLSPFIRPGESNVIELWPFSTMTYAGNNHTEESDMQLDAIRIGCR